MMELCWGFLPWLIPSWVGLGSVKTWRIGCDLEGCSSNGRMLEN
jgi:hypothetical protein